MNDKTNYNLVAGQDLDRVAALSDGVFAFAMTLLIFNLHIPIGGAIHTEQALWQSLLNLSPQFLTYFMSFLTLGIFWVGQQTQLNQFARSDRNLTWIMLGFLFLVSVMPFSTALLAGFITYRLALVIYWLNILLLGSTLFLSRRYASKAKLVKEDLSIHEWKAVDKRIIISQSLYAVGALFCIVNTFISIGIIIVVQLNYVLAPRIPKLYHW